MEISQKTSKLEVIFLEIVVKGFLLGFTMFLYVAVVWYAGHRETIGNLVGFSAIFLCLILVFVPVRNKAFKKMAIAPIVFSVLFFAIEGI